MRTLWMAMAAIEFQADEFRKQLIEYLKSNEEYGFKNELYLDFLVSTERLHSFSFTDTDGMSEEILGKYSFHSNEITIYNGINHKGRENFTVAHEVGHCVLHRPILLSSLKYYEIDAEELEHPFLLHRDSVDHKGYQSANKVIATFESQANKFARYLLMPRKPFTAIFRELMGGVDLGIGHFKDFSYRPVRRDIDKLNEINRELANIFDTSGTASAIHLKQLGFIDKSLRIT